MAGQPPHVKIRRLEGYDEMMACSTLQEKVWGAQDVVPATALVAIQKVGGLIAGAFDELGHLIGTVLGVTGLREGHLVHWSHMLAVEEPWRDRGLGRRLKVFQRKEILKSGIHLIHWTFDPLEARNAHLNINRLGVEIDEYARDVYGAGAGKKLHNIIGTDRFVVSWHLDSQRATRALGGTPPPLADHVARAPAITEDPRVSDVTVPLDDVLMNAPMARVEVPPDIQTVRGASAEDALRWRQATRRSLVHCMTHGYKVDGFYRDAGTKRCFYVLTRVEEDRERTGDTR